MFFTQGNSPDVNPEMQAFLLENLRDIHTPEAIGWWPLAVGWWVLAGLFLCLIICFAIRRYLLWKQNAYRRYALAAANHLQKKYDADYDSVFYIEHANQLLKRVMLKLHSPAQSGHSGNYSENLAELSGKRWVQALNQHTNLPFSEQATDALVNQVYRAEPNIDVASFHDELVRWVRSHQRIAVPASAQKSSAQ